jgi:hypothetical protein
MSGPAARCNRNDRALTGNEVRPMTIPARTPAEHYAEAARLLAAAESSRTTEIQSTDALIALGHAVLATVPRRRSRQRKTETSAFRTSGGSPRARWERGEDEDGQR